MRLDLQRVLDVTSKGELNGHPDHAVVLLPIGVNGWWVLTLGLLLRLLLLQENMMVQILGFQDLQYVRRPIVVVVAVVYWNLDLVKLRFRFLLHLHHVQHG